MSGHVRHVLSRHLNKNAPATLDTSGGLTTTPPQEGADAQER